MLLEKSDLDTLLLDRMQAMYWHKKGQSMSRDQPPVFPSWDERYRQQAVESMPWFYPELDDDLRQALDQLGLQNGRALDLGTGPGTQAMQLAQRGFEMTATDISKAAIRLAREKAEAQALIITWQQDDVLATRLSGPFDLIFDRGCFHVLPPERRQDYVNTIAGLLKPDGYFFLKCFSHLQPGMQGPHRFTPDQIRALFSRQLQVHSITETVYQGTLDPLPRALFGVMQRAG
jgi:2-polyprenyl-3-methyl-5-hydroxy-6-metoxy-1,4-benzoquinol methylase